MKLIAVMSFLLFCVVAVTMAPRLIPRTLPTIKPITKSLPPGSRTALLARLAPDSRLDVLDCSPCI